MTLVIIFELDNAGFRLDDESLDRPAVCEALDQVAVGLMSDKSEDNIRDINGHTVGDWTLKGEL